MIEESQNWVLPPATQLTASADIKLNARLSLRAPTEKITSRTGHFPDPPSQSRGSNNSGRWSCLKDIDLMIRYSSYAATNYRTNPGAPTKLCSLPMEYRELQALRERVRMAEAAARDVPAPSRKSALSLIDQRRVVK